MTSGGIQYGETKARAPARIAFAILVILLIMIAIPRSAQPQPGLINREAKLKAVFVYKFTKYVTWPEEAFEESDSPLVIGVVGNDPVNGYLKAISRKTKAGIRPLEYVEVGSPKEAAGCHILFFGDLAPPTLTKDVADEMLQTKQPVLMVGEVPNFAGPSPALGGTIEFFVANNKVRLRMSKSAANNANLKVSSQLAKITKVVP